jgi:hypothetical protein
MTDQNRRTGLPQDPSTLNHLNEPIAARDRRLGQSSPMASPSTLRGRAFAVWVVTADVLLLRA